VDPTIFSKIQLEIQFDVKRAVKVANGQIVQIEGFCLALPVRVQGTNFFAEFYMLPLGGCHMVLGVHWLRSLDPIIWDFSNLTMEFSILSQRIVWKGLAPT
jgi:hypothetical protein